MYLRPTMTLRGSAAGVTATFVTAPVSMDCMSAFHHVVGIWTMEHCSVPPPLLGAPANGNRKLISLSSRSTIQPSARGASGDEISRFSYPRNFSNSDLITVNRPMLVVTYFVIEVFPSIVSDL